MAEDASTAVSEPPVVADPASPEQRPGAGRDASPAETAPPSPAARPETPAVSPSPRTPGEAEPSPARRVAADPTPTPEPAPAEPAILDWKAMIPAEVRGDKIWEKHKTLPDALQALVNQEHLMGRMIPLPRDGASDAQMRAFYERLGCPKLPADYVITDPDMGTDADGNAKTLAPEFLTSLLEVAHQAGLRTEQAQQFINFAARTAVRSENIQAGARAAQRAQSERDLYDAFGGEAPAMIEKARMFIINLGSGRYGGGAYAERAAEKWKTSVLANDIDAVAAFANGFDNFREGIWVGDEMGGSLSSLEQMDADEHALASLMNDEAKPMEARKEAQRKHYALLQKINEVREANARRQQTLRR